MGGGSRLVRARATAWAEMPSETLEGVFPDIQAMQEETPGRAANGAGARRRGQRTGRTLTLGRWQSGPELLLASRPPRD